MAGQLKEVRNRISSVTSTQKITKAMKLVAASKLRRAQDRILQMRPYATKLYSILGNILNGNEGDLDIEYGKVREVENVLIIPVTSDRGLCGGFNSNIAKEITLLLKGKYSSQYQAGKVTMIPVGKKGFEAFNKDSKISMVSDYVELFSDLTFENVSELSELIMKAFEDKTYDAVEVVYNQFKNQITQIPTAEQYLPIQQLETPTPTEDEEPEMQVDYIFEPDKDKIIEELLPKIMKTQFYRYLLNSNASEHGARMTAMDNATENAEELLRDLKIMYNRARQAAITTEISEIVSGAAALQG